MVFSINFCRNWLVWYHCLTASLYYQKNPNNFWHLLHSEVIFCVVFIINPSYLYWLASKIPSAKKYKWIYFVLLWDSFLCILCLLLWWWSSWSSVCNCNVDNTSLYGAYFWPSWFAIWDMWTFHSRTFSCLIFRIGEADRQTQTLPKWINLQPFSYQSSIWFMRVSCLENSRSGLAYKCPMSHSVLENEWDGNKKIPLLLNNFICFPLPMKEKICHLILRIGKKVRNKRKRKWCPFQNHSFEFMIFNGGNLVWKYLKSWAKCQDKQLYVFLSRKG